MIITPSGIVYCGSSPDPPLVQLFTKVNDTVSKLTKSRTISYSRWKKYNSTSRNRYYWDRYNINKVFRKLKISEETVNSGGQYSGLRIYGYPDLSSSGTCYYCNNENYIIFDETSGLYQLSSNEAKYINSTTTISSPVVTKYTNQSIGGFGWSGRPEEPDTIVNTYNVNIPSFTSISEKFEKYVIFNISGYFTCTATMIIYGNEIDSDKSTIGNMIGTNSSLNRQEYPDNGISGNYWYIYSKSSIEYIQGSTYYGEVYDINPSKYPSNGRYSDGYWYVKVA